MIVKYKYIPKISWPIYKLSQDDITITDGLVFIGHELLDDRNMPGKSLGLRRLQTSHKNLYELHKGAYSIPELLKHKSWVDSSGKILEYQKTKVVALKHHLIKKVEKKDTCSIIWVSGVPFPFEVRNPPSDLAKYCRILYSDKVNPWLIYDFTIEKGKDTVRKI